MFALPPPLCIAAAVGLIGGASTACSPEARPSEYQFVVRIQSDPGIPLAGAAVRYKGRSLGVSGREGSVVVSVRGREGERLSLDIACPDGYRSPIAPLSLGLHALELDRDAEYSADCPPLTRKLVVAVRLDGAPQTPILQFGKELGRTDDAGAAHLLFDGKPDDFLELTLDTMEHPALRPRSPVARFRVGNRDEVLILNQSFVSVEHKTVVPRRRSGPTAPVRIN